MSDPKRLFESDDELGGLLRAGKSEAPSDEHMTALAAKLGALGLFDGGFDGGGGSGGAGGDGGAATALKGGATSAGAAAAKGGLVVKVLSGVAIATALGGGGAVVATRMQPAPVEVPSAGLVARASSTSTGAPSVSASPLVLEEPLPSAVPSAKVVKVVPSSPASAAPAESEVKMLERAQDALRARPSEALAIADDHARRYPGGMLAQEREVIAIEALARTGRAADAKARAARFEQRFPGSAQIPRVRSLVGITP